MRPQHVGRFAWMIVLLFASTVWAQDPAAARKEHTKSLAKAREVYDEAVAQATDKLIADLKAAMEAQTKAGKLDAALALREEINKLVEEKAAGTAAEPAVRSRLIPGTWSVEYPNITRRIYEIRSTGQMTCTEKGRVSKGTFRVAGKDLLLDFGTGSVERVVFAEGRLYVEHYNPKGRYPKEAPSSLGVGTLMSPKK